MLTKLAAARRSRAGFNLMHCKYCGLFLLQTFVSNTLKPHHILFLFLLISVINYIFTS